MHSGGDESAGFSVDVETSSRKIVVRGWGFWSSAISTNFGNAVRDACTSSTQYSLVMDLTDLKPMREEGQLTFATLARTLPQLVSGPVVITTSSHLTKLQLLRIVAGAAPNRAIEIRGSDAKLER